MDEGAVWREKVIAEATANLVARYRTELPGYAILSDSSMREDVEFSISWHSHLVLSADPTAHHPSGALFTNSTTRRFDQGISMDELLRSYELWAEELWRIISSGAHETPMSESRALSTAAALARHVDSARVATERRYAELSVTGPGVGSTGLRPDQVRRLLSTDEESDNARFLAAFLRLDLGLRHALILLRSRESATDSSSAPGLRDTATSVVSAHRADLRVAGSDGEDTVLVCATIDHDAWDGVRDAADEIAEARPDVLVAVSGPRMTRGGFARSYEEAREAMSPAPVIAAGRALLPSDATVNRMLRRGDRSPHLWADTIGPLRLYDSAHSSDLLYSLQCYIAADLQVAAASAHLHVHPNTLRYRLHRIRHVTGHDPMTARGLFLLMAGLRLAHHTGDGPTEPNLS